MRVTLLLNSTNFTIKGSSRCYQVFTRERNLTVKRKIQIPEMYKSREGCLPSLKLINPTR